MSAPEHIRKKALALCANYLGGNWKDESKFKVDVLNGGLTNKLFICSTEDADSNRIKVVLRIYGLIMQDVDAQITESVVFAVLGSRGLGPQLYGAFPEGRLEEYIPGRNLITSELQDPELSVTIAKRLADYHKLQMPMTKEPRMLEQFKGYYEKAKLLGVDMTQYEKPFFECCNIIKNSNSPILFCHNDVHEGNILIDERVKKQGKDESECLRLIDFEYSAYGYRGFDFANHFNEWMYDYSNPEWPHYHYNPHHFPSEEQQRRFIGAYLERSGNYSEENIKIIQEEMIDFAQVGHVYWALWSEIQAKVCDIKFDYVGYAKDRMDSYRKLLVLTRTLSEGIQINQIESAGFRQEIVIN